MPGETVFAESTSAWDYMPDYLTGQKRPHPLTIYDEDRFYHLAAIGRTGAGKSVLLQNLMYQDLALGHGFCLIEPHGDVALAALDMVPKHRIKDVVYLNPGDSEFPSPFNVLSAVDASQHHLVASGLVSIFKRFFGDAFGPRSEYLAQNAILALLEVPGATLLDIARLLTDDEFRARTTAAVVNPAVRRYWQNEFPAYTPGFRQEVISPILNKLGGFAYTPLVRNIMGQRRNLFELRRIMDEGKVLIVNLGKGFMGEGTAALFGSMLVTSLMTAAFTRQDLPETARRPFFLYLDEFQNFATPATLATLLSETRKFKIGVTLSWQYLAQLSDELRGATFGNVGTTVSFRVGAEDAEYLARELAPVAPSELTDLDLHHIYVKQTKGGVILPPISAKTLPPPRVPTSYRHEIIRRSRQCYARPRAIAEQEATGRYLSIPRSSAPSEKRKHALRIPPPPVHP